MNSHNQPAGGVLPGFAAGIEAAARWVDARREAFENEHGHVDPETGALEFGRGAHAEAKLEYSAELFEIAEGLRALTPPAPVPADPWREHLAQQAENIDTERLASALTWMGVSPAGDGQEGFAARLGENVNRLTRAVDAHKAGFAAKAADPVAAWLPIEGAPHGKNLLVGWRSAKGHWFTAICCFYEAGTLPLHDDAAETEDGYAPAGWYEESTTAECILPPDGKPTHYLPFAAPLHAEGGE